MANPVEHIKAKVAGISGAAEARFKGLKGVFTKLAEQHHQVSSLLSTIEKTDDLTRRAALWAEIRRELVSHEQAELLQVYPLLEDYETTREIARLHTQAAGELETAVQELDGIGFQSDAWQPALERLIEKVRAHVELEEEQLFPRAQEILGDDVARELEVPFERAKELALQQLG
jgi:hemerythrin superfamily protein